MKFELASNDTIIDVLEFLPRLDDSPFVLKGALALNIQLLNISDDINIRLSEDIDIYLDRAKLKFLDLITIVEEALSSLGLLSSIEVQKVRTPKRNSGGRIALKYKNGLPSNDDDLFFTIDVDIDELVLPTVDRLLPSGVVCRLSNIENICADKIDAISKPKVLRRIKDVYDIFLISNAFEPEYQDIKKCIDAEQGLHDFGVFLTNVAGLKTAYSELGTLRDINRKPAFETVYIRACDFLRPFGTTNLTYPNAKWSIQCGKWIKDPNSVFSKRDKNKVK